MDDGSDARTVPRSPYRLCDLWEDVNKGGQSQAERTFLVCQHLDLFSKSAELRYRLGAKPTLRDILGAPDSLKNALKARMARGMLDDHVRQVKTFDRNQASRGAAEWNRVRTVLTADLVLRLHRLEFSPWQISEVLKRARRALPGIKYPVGVRQIERIIRLSPADAGLPPRWGRRKKKAVPLR